MSPKLTVFLIWTIGILHHAKAAGPDNRGKEFIIGFMENQGTSIDVEVFVTTMRTIAVTFNVTAPGFSSSLFFEHTIKAGEVQQLFFPPSIRPKKTEKQSNAIWIQASDEVVIYGVNKEQYSNDAYLGVPVDVLGQDYYTVTYSPATQQCSILVVGIEDGTSVSVKLPSVMDTEQITWNGVQYGAGDTITETINRFDTWQLVTPKANKGDLTGAHVTSNKKVAVISGNKKTKIGSGGSSDHLCEMMIPIERWGKNFITVPTPDRTVGDYFRFIAANDSTTVTISGGHTETFTLNNAGDMHQSTIDSGAYCSITADKAILVVHFVLSQQSSSEPSDPAMMIIPPIEQYAADYTFTTPKYSKPPATYTSYFMFVIKDSEKDGLKVDGQAFSTTYNSVTHGGVTYAAGYIQVSEGTHTVRHDSPIKVFGGYLYGRANYETYAFTTGMRMAPINADCSVTVTAVGDGIDNDCDGLIDEEACWDANQDDDGDSRLDEDCATPPPVDGMWNDWMSWSACSKTCFSTTGGANIGYRSRTRKCDNPAPAYDGKQCVGNGDETESCQSTVYCKVDGQWSAWGSWGSCTKTCGSGTESRSRTCTNPAPLYGGDDCPGQDKTEYRQGCNPSACPTASSNNYIQLCASGYFTCLSGKTTCIDETKKCDCNRDCEDGSDELESYASCSPSLASYCTSGNLPSSASGKGLDMMLVVTSAVFAVIVSYKAIMYR